MIPERPASLYAESCGGSQIEPSSTANTLISVFSCSVASATHRRSNDVPSSKTGVSTVKRYDWSTLVSDLLKANPCWSREELEARPLSRKHGPRRPGESRRWLSL